MMTPAAKFGNGLVHLRDALPAPVVLLFQYATLAALTWLIAALSIEYTRGTERIAAVWPVNAVLVVTLLRHARQTWPALLGAMGAGMFCANLAAGDPVLRAAWLLLANLVEVLSVCLLFTFRRRRNLLTTTGLLAFAGAAVAGCFLSVSLALLGLSVTGYRPDFHDAATWFSADLLGLILFAPVLWSLAARSRMYMTGQFNLRTVFDMLVVAAVTFYVFAQTSYPFLFLIPPVLVMLAFSSGVKGAAIGQLIVAFISIPLTLADSGPPSLMDADMTGKVLTLQIFLATNSILALAVGAAASDKNRIMQQLVRSEQRLRSRTAKQNEMLAKAQLAERMAGVGHWSLDPATQRIEWSPEVYAIHGVTPEEFNPMYDDAISFYIEEDRDMVNEHVNTGIGKGEGWEFKATLVRRSDGAHRQVQSIGDCLKDDEGNVTRVFGVFRDITEEQAMFERLAENERQYRILAEHSTDIVVQFGLDGVITYASPSCRVLGVTPEQAIGMSTVEFAIPEDRQFATNITRQLFTGAEPDRSVRREFRVRRTDGTLMWLEGNPTLVRGDDGKALFVVSNFRNVTDRREREDALAAARREAESAAKAKAEFMSNMSHEIRTPLNGILGFKQLLAQTELDDEQMGYVERMAVAGRMLRDVVDDILDFSKIEAGRMEIAAAPMRLSDTVDEVIGLVDAGRTNKNVSLSFTAEPIGICADETRLRQILTNVLGNAAKFTQSGRIELRAFRQGEQVCIEVEDTGPGIPAGQLDKVFEGFRQADSGITRKFGGTGLGLAISRSLARLMGGDLTLESTEGVGTTARLTFPYVAATLPDAPKQYFGKASGGGNLRIMAVDDVEMNLDFLRAGLGRAGYEVHTFTSATAAIEALKAGEQPDLILMDIQMPEVDGLRATRMIRDMKGPVSKLPIIALTANVLPEHVRACLDAGMNAHSPKPVELPKLIAQIKTTAGVVARTGNAAPAPDADPFEGLRDQYRSYLRGMSQEFAGILATSTRETVLEKVRALAHSIAGTSGSFGFTDVSQAAFDLEASAVDMMGADEFGEKFIDDVRHFLQVIERTVQRAAMPAPSGRRAAG